MFDPCVGVETMCPNDEIGSSKVSVVVVTHNRCKALARCLSALQRQTYSNFEIIVVDSNSTDDTPNLVGSYRNAELVQIKAMNVPQKRNIGIKESLGEIVAFIDDDAIPADDWLSNVVESYNYSSKIGGAGGKSRSNRYDPMYPLDFAKSDEENTPTALARFLFGCNCSFRKKVLLEIGCFDERFATRHEETDLCERVLRAGYRLLYNPKIVVYHDWEPGNITRQARIGFRDGFYGVLLKVKYGERLRYIWRSGFVAPAAIRFLCHGNPRAALSVLLRSVANSWGIFAGILVWQVDQKVTRAISICLIFS